MPFINGIGPVELIIILVIALIVVGPGKLPDVGSALGKSIREFRKAATDVKESVSLDAAPASPASASAPAAPPAPAPVVTTPAVAALPPAPPAPPMVPPAPVAAEPVAARDAASGAGTGTEASAAGEWPAEATPVDEGTPTASA